MTVTTKMQYQSAGYVKVKLIADPLSNTAKCTENAQKPGATKKDL